MHGPQPQPPCARIKGTYHHTQKEVIVIVPNLILLPGNLIMDEVTENNISIREYNSCAPFTGTEKCFWISSNNKSTVFIIWTGANCCKLCRLNTDQIYDFITCHLFMCVCARVCVCVYTSLHRRRVCVCRGQKTTSVVLITILFPWGSVSHKTYLSWQPASPRDLPNSISLSAVVTGTYMTTLSFFYRGLGNQIQVLTLAQQARLLTEQSPQPFDLLF